jgi:hypothetical protein
MRLVFKSKVFTSFQTKFQSKKKGKEKEKGKRLKGPRGRIRSTTETAHGPPSLLPEPFSSFLSLGR